MGIYWLWVLVFLIGMLPSYVFMIATIVGLPDYYDARYDGFPTGLLAAIVVMFINAIVLLVVLVRYCMVWYVLMDDQRIGVFDALRRSAAITKGNSHNIILLGVVSALISMAAFLLLILPYFLLAAPVLSMAFSRAYINLRDDYIRVHGTVPPGSYPTGGAYPPPTGPAPGPPYQPPPTPPPSPSS